MTITSKWSNFFSLSQNYIFQTALPPSSSFSMSLQREKEQEELMLLLYQISTGVCMCVSSRWQPQENIHFPLKRSPERSVLSDCAPWHKCRKSRSSWKGSQLCYLHPSMTSAASSPASALFVAENGGFQRVRHLPGVRENTKSLWHSYHLPILSVFKVIGFCGELTQLDIRCSPNCSITPLLSWPGEIKYNERLVGWDEGRDTTQRLP